jgi:hypothetical protein
MKKTKLMPLAIIALMAIAIYIPQASAAPIAVLISPTTAPSGTWSNPTNAFADGTTYASAQTANAQQVYSGYVFSNAGSITTVKVNATTQSQVTWSGLWVKVEASVDGGATWPISQNIAVTAFKTATIIDITSLKAIWSASDISNLKVRITDIGLTTFSVWLHWIPIEVTYNADVPQNVIPEVPFGTIAILSALAVGMIVYAKRGKIPSLKSF